MVDPVHLTELDSEGLKQFLDSFDHVFSDCDGVIWEASQPLPGSGEFIALMRKLGKTVHFVSNNSIRTKQNYENQFKLAGIPNGFGDSTREIEQLSPRNMGRIMKIKLDFPYKIELFDFIWKENLTIPSLAIAEFLKSKNFEKYAYCVTCPETKNMLRASGLKIKEGPDVAPEFSELGQFFDDDPDVGAVVLDCDTNLNLPKIYRALTYLKRDDVYFISGATDKHWVVKRGQTAVGAGFFTTLIAEESKREPIQLGKPGKIFGEFAMKRAKVTDPSRVLFIGDMIAQDVGLGKATGFKTLLVLPHHTVEEMLSQDKLRPDYYAKSLGCLVPLLKDLGKTNCRI